MKKLLSLPVCALLLFGACQQNEIPAWDPTEGLNGEVVLENCVLTEDYVVPIVDGMNTLVTDARTNKVLYDGNMPATIKVAKAFGTTKASLDELIVANHYKPSNNITFRTKSRSGVMIFEDIKTGDADYNDFVCYIDETLSVTGADGSYTVDLGNTGLTPLALGAYLRLGFGFEIRNSKTGAIVYDELLTTNIREDYFKGQEGFINTENGGPFQDRNHTTTEVSVSGKTINLELDAPIAVNWYIVTYGAESHVNGNKHYTTESVDLIRKGDSGISYNQLITDKSVPYGIFVPGVDETEFQWALEKVRLEEAYPKFADWLNGENVDPFSVKVSSNLYAWPGMSY